MQKEKRILISEWNGLKRYKYPEKEAKQKNDYFENKKKIIKKVSKIKNFSVKRQKQNNIYSNVRKEYLQENENCEAKLENCSFEATEIHHKKGRIGELLTNKKYFLATCRNCHEWIETNPIEAKEKELSLHRFNN